MNNLKKAAEILVECGYGELNIDYPNCVVKRLENNILLFDIDPFADTLEGRRQADAIEDWLCSKYELIPNSVWELSLQQVRLTSTRHQWRLDRIKWCLDNLRGSDDTNN